MYGCTDSVAGPPRPGQPGLVSPPSSRTARLTRQSPGCTSADARLGSARLALAAMPRAIYVDCFSGASGDMLLGALLDAGLDLDALRAGLSSLPVQGWQLEAEPAQQHGLHGTRARV